MPIRPKYPKPPLPPVFGTSKTSQDHEIEALTDKIEELNDDKAELVQLFTMSLFLNVAFVAATVVTWLI